MNILINDIKVDNLLKKVEEITEYKYDNDLVSIISALEDMVIEYKNLDMAFDDYKSEIKEHCTPLSIAEEIGTASYRGY